MAYFFKKKRTLSSAKGMVFMALKMPPLNMTINSASIKYFPLWTLPYKKANPRIQAKIKKITNVNTPCFLAKSMVSSILSLCALTSTFWSEAKVSKILSMSASEKPASVKERTFAAMLVLFFSSMLLPRKLKSTNLCYRKYVSVHSLYLLIFILFFTPFAFRFCFKEAGERYNIDAHILRAIAKQESNFQASSIHQNSQTTDLGLMQINSVWLKKLSRFGITRQVLLEKPCVNVMVGAWILATNFKTHGRNWNSIGAYNAGFSKKITLNVSSISKRLSNI